METLLQKQWRFMRLVPRLIDKAHELGFEVTIGDGFRDDRVFGEVGVKLGYGHPSSAHKVRLAVDLNLFRDGAYMNDTEAHAELGTFWETLAPDCRWGGRFRDGNHYSIEHRGIR